jgi:hypothetical protein
MNKEAENQGEAIIQRQCASPGSDRPNHTAVLVGLYRCMSSLYALCLRMCMRMGTSRQAWVGVIRIYQKAGKVTIKGEVQRKWTNAAASSI